MIYILDNGMDYSAHAIVFMRVPEHLMKYKAEIEPMLLRSFSLHSSYCEPKILGTVESIDWWQGSIDFDFSRRVDFQCFIGDWYEGCGQETTWTLPPHPKCPNQEPRHFYKTDFVPVPDEVMAYLLEQWRTVLRELDPDDSGPWLSTIFNLIEEMMKNGDLR